MEALGVGLLASDEAEHGGRPRGRSCSIVGGGAPVASALGDENEQACSGAGQGQHEESEMERNRVRRRREWIGARVRRR
jgi:hypothetical protein